MTDLITNSSTTIFTYYDGSLDVCKEMINEFFKICGVDKTADEIFNFVVLCDYYDYADYYDYENNTVSDLTRDEFDLIKQGLKPKPSWFTKVEKEDCDGSRRSNNLFITPKDPTYTKCGELICKFLSSSYSESSYE